MSEFADYDLKKETIDALSLLGYVTLTPIQEKVIPLLLHGRDVVGKSQTGSGKTAAFGIPICDPVFWEENSPQALVLEPTRELAVQVKEELFQIGRKRRLKIPVVFGGMPIDKEIISLKQKSHIVVGTPGRVMDHIRKGSLVLSSIRYLIIDEADLMLDMGFIEEVESIILEVQEATEKALEATEKVQKALFSATLGEHLDALIHQYMNQAEQIVIEGETETAEYIIQCAYEVENEEKFQLLLKLLMQENPKECMIFCETREMVNALYQQLKRKNIRCGM